MGAEGPGAARLAHGANELPEQLVCYWTSPMPWNW
jgi:hypothetical protein